MAQKRMGRPPSDDAMTDRIFVYVDKETKQQLNDCAKTLNTSRSDVVRKGIRKMYDDLKK